jgi:hypothetical protein
MSPSKKIDLTRFIKNPQGDKVEMKVTSLNIELRQLEFLRRHNLNLSLLIREYLDNLIQDSELLSDTNNEPTKENK